MTGSGKTGLGISLIEEAAIDGIPVLAIDPKGDLGNLLLTFPNLAPRRTSRRGSMRVRHSDTARRSMRTQPRPPAMEGRSCGVEPGRRAHRPSEGGGRRHRLHAGKPDWHAARRPRIARAGGRRPRARTRSPTLPRPPRVCSVWSASRMWSRTAVNRRCSRRSSRAARAGAAADLRWLVQQIQRPTFESIGVLDLETFFPARERQELALRFNSVLAAPGFDAWSAGEPLDAAALLFTPAGKPRIAIVSVAHLDDQQRMLVVSLVLNAVLRWTRRQTGTSSLRALVYMDEVFGYLPPVANPPSKLPLLTLLKQARAFGVGLVLATQNPVDLDYKALSNTGTWFLGKLQTERDKARMLDGLEGVSSGLDRQAIDRALSSLRGRVFLMHNVHEQAPITFETRWATVLSPRTNGTRGAAPLRARSGESAATTPPPIPTSPVPPPRRIDRQAPRPRGNRRIRAPE